MASSSILFPTAEDLELLYPGKSEKEAVEALRAAGADIVALTRGVEGAVIFHGDARFDCCGHDVAQIDQDGAGDCFCGTFLAMVAEGHSIETAGRYANAAAALACGKRGPMEGNSSLIEIEALLSSQQEERKRA